MSYKDQEWKNNFTKFMNEINNIGNIDFKKVNDLISLVNLIKGFPESKSLTVDNLDGYKNGRE
jgi:hypothetical protein